jgi:phosphoribosylformylglycinamidine synthase
VLKGVVSGVRDYGNRMGIPTVNGAIVFDERYLANPLVFCGCVGLIPRSRIPKKVNPQDRIVLAGGRTGRDGIHGATFSSAELTDAHADLFAHAVQIGNAIEEKKLLDALLLARDHPQGCLFSAVTDCGAGGLSSAVGEMAAKLGAAVDLEKVPLKYAGLRYDEIWISEAQERMVFAVPPDRLDVFLEVFAAEEVEATVIGAFTGDGTLRVRFRGETVGELDVRFLHEGLPKTVRQATWFPVEPRTSVRATLPEPRTPALEDVVDDGNDRLLAALRDLNVASKEWVIRQYDHEVQSRSVIKPLVGPGFGPADAAVLRPRWDGYRGIALGCGLCPWRTDSDPYLMAIAAVDEALRNVICVGADPSRTAILDNFCWPKVDSPESLGSLVRACQGAADAAVAYGLPFISGKDSLNNEFTMGEEEAVRTGLPARLAIPGTLLISSLGIVDDVRRCVSMDLKEPGNVLVLATAPVDQVGMLKALELHQQVAGLIQDAKVRAAHDVSDGGLAVAIAEMCIAGQMGAHVADSAAFPLSQWHDDVSSTYVLEMSEGDALACGLPILGRVTTDSRLVIGQDGRVQVDLQVDALTRAWKQPLPLLAGT